LERCNSLIVKVLMRVRMDERKKYVSNPVQAIIGLYLMEQSN